MRSFRHTLVLLIVFLVGRGSQCCRGQPNDNKIIDADFQLVGGHEFGQKFVFEMSATGQTFYLLKLHGTAYQAGFAYGTLMRRELQKLVHDLWAYYYSVAEEEFKFITKLPERLQPAGRAFAIQLYKGLLTANYVVTRKYTPKRFMDELAGLAAGSGLTINELIQLNMIPEYTRAGCSILGAWGKATADGAMIHLRALDWDVNNPMN